MIASGLTLGASKEALEQGAELQSERVKMSTAGIQGAEIDAALSQSAQEVTQDPSYENHAKLYAGAKGLDAAGANNQDPFVALNSLTTSMQKASGTFRRVLGRPTLGRPTFRTTLGRAVDFRTPPKSKTGQKASKTGDIFHVRDFRTAPHF